MKKANYIPFDIEALDRDTMLLTEDEFAIYMRLIIQYYKHGKPLPNDDKKLARMTRTHIRKFRNVWGVISEFFIVSNDVITHLKCDYTITKMKLKSETNKANVLKRHNTPVTDVIHKDKDKDKDKDNSKKEQNFLYNSLFIEFYNLYGYKQGRVKALKKYFALLEGGGEELHNKIMQGVHLYIKNRGSDPAFWKHPTTFLNGEHWADEYLNNGGIGGSNVALSDEGKKNVARMMEEGRKMSEERKNNQITKG